MKIHYLDARKQAYVLAAGGVILATAIRLLPHAACSENNDPLHCVGWYGTASDYQSSDPVPLRPWPSTPGRRYIAS